MRFTVSTFNMCFTTRGLRQAILKKVSQDVKACGSFSKYTLEDAKSSASSEPAGPPSTLALRTATETDYETNSTLALPMDVETIKKLARSMSHAECHALAFYFNTRCAASPVVELGVVRQTIVDKKAAARIFQLPPPEWEEQAN